MYVVGYIQGRQQFQMTFILGEISVQVLECPYCILPCSTSFSFSWQIQAFSLLTSALYLWGSGSIMFLFLKNSLRIQKFSYKYFNVYQPPEHLKKCPSVCTERLNERSKLRNYRTYVDDFFIQSDSGSVRVSAIFRTFLLPLTVPEII